jgi:beta-phosphoglucomutase-like phosphatase (HAD superfamily)
MDKGIITAMLEKLGFPASEENIARGAARMEQIFVETSTEITEIPIGIVDIVEFLSKQPNITMGLASGHFPGIAWRKLTLAGLAKYFPNRIERRDALLTARKSSTSALQCRPGQCHWSPDGGSSLSRIPGT